MNSTLRRIIPSLAIVASCLAAPVQAEYPERPITMVVPWAAGGSTDILARALAEKLTQELGQPVVVENRAGASGNIGTNVVARAKPDGHTLLVGSMSTHAMNPYLMPSMPFEGVDDFTPIALLANVINTVVVHPTLPVHNIPELIAHAKANPGKLNYASAGVGSTNHLSAVLFEKAAGIEMVHVPYKGGAPAVVDTVANQTQVLFSAGTQTLPHVQSGKLRLLAVTEPARSKLLPDVPAVGETLPDYQLAVWYGLFGPAGMADDLVQRLNRITNEVMSSPDVRARMEGMGVEVITETPERFEEVLKTDADYYGKIIRELGIVYE